VSPDLEQNATPRALVNAIFGCLAGTQMLFEEGGADLNATTDTGETPLTLAASQGLKHIAEYLVSLPGVDLNKTGSDGKLPEIIALESTHMETARIIRTARIARGGFNPNKSGGRT
jgi:ankyrin repeat protein